nr:hypothetical protein Itr_chr09CG01890 [Ipomoea trifida]
MYALAEFGHILCAFLATFVYTTVDSLTNTREYLDEKNTRFPSAKIYSSSGDKLVSVFCSTIECFVLNDFFLNLIFFLLFWSSEIWKREEI